jgi:hypothetical protein
MDDAPVISHIESLVEEEQKLLANEQRDAADDEALAADRQRLERISIELDRCWDLLRQRRALRDAGQRPEEAQVRDADTVERYQQ